ncbi:hypothetical protein MKW92_028406 [Papaver armeniacum]|nr:hypothetical protein MKW92_028406 [Papaver armeniacum]
MLSVKKVCVRVLVLVFTMNGALSISLLEQGKHINHFYHGDSFVYMNFKNAASNLSFGNGAAAITPNRLLRLTNNTHQIGHAFHSRPLRFKNNTKQNSSSETKNPSSGGNVLSFSTSFIFSIIKENPRAVDAGLSGQGIAFVLAPQPELPGATGNGYLGLFNSSNNGNFANHALAVEIDTVYNKEFDTINGDHVGININGIRSVVIASPPKYYTDSNGGSRKLGLTSEDRIQVWIEYDGVGMKLSVTLAPITVPKPDIPLLSYKHDLSEILLDSMYAGFSSSTGSPPVSYYMLGWSFEINQRETDDRNAKIFGVELPIIIPVFVLLFLIGVVFVALKIRSEKLADVAVEDWELNHGRLRFSYKDLYIATNGFKEKELLGVGGFGRVYKGILRTSNTNVAVKRISHDSKQGIREFTSEIISIGHLRHRNLAHLLGYCRRNSELLLVYDYMPNGSLDKLIFRHSDSTSTSPVLSWNQRFQIIKGVACGLVYLHEEWEQVVIHRDVKASNVLLDCEMNARLGDFGLARLYTRGTKFQTTKVVGTLGYIAPEMSRTGRATTCSDVFSFGALLLEVACGRRPVELNKSEAEEGEVLVDWVLNCWRSGDILQTTDPNLLNEYVKEEMEIVLKLGLLCSRIDPQARPSMRQVMQYLEGHLPLPDTDLWALNLGTLLMSTSTGECRSCAEIWMNQSSSALGSVLSGPR